MNESQLELVKELGIEHLSPEDQEKIIVGIGENILKQIIVNVYDKIDEAHRDEFHTLIESGDIDEMHAFLQDKITDVDAVIEDARAQIIGEFKTLLQG